MPYGYVTTAAQYKEDLKRENRDYEGRKTWDAMFSNIDLARQQQISSLQQDYSKAMGEAYASAYNNRTAVAASNIGQGYKLSAYDDIDAALEEAYDTYRANYEQNVSKVNQATNEIAASVDEALTNEAQNYKAVNDSLYPYLQDLWNKFDEGELKDNIFYNNQLWTRYTREQKDETTGEIIKDAEGNIMRELMPFEDIQSIMYDSDGKITAKGREFIDQMLNDFATDERYNKYSFGAYLSKTNPELLDWLNSRDLYNFTAEGTKYGTYKDMIGPDISDNQYSFIERWGAMNKEEVDAFIEPLVEKWDKFENTALFNNVEEIDEYYGIKSSNSGVKPYLVRNDNGKWVSATAKDIGNGNYDAGKAKVREWKNARSEYETFWASDEDKKPAKLLEKKLEYGHDVVNEIANIAENLGIEKAYEEKYGVNLRDLADKLADYKVDMYSDKEFANKKFSNDFTTLSSILGFTAYGFGQIGPVGALLGLIAGIGTSIATSAIYESNVENMKNENKIINEQVKETYKSVLNDFYKLIKNNF